MMMTAIQRKKDSDQSLVLLQNILLVLNLREVTRNQKHKKKSKKRRHKSDSPESDAEREKDKKKKTGKAKKTELDKDQNQNTNHLRKRLERILVIGILLAVN